MKSGAGLGDKLYYDSYSVYSDQIWAILFGFEAIMLVQCGASKTGQYIYLNFSAQNDIIISLSVTYLKLFKRQSVCRKPRLNCLIRSDAVTL